MKRLALLLLTIAVLGCGGSARDPAEAISTLTGVKKWNIDEIKVNDAITFQDGKMTQQFGSIDFSRYMETVEWKKDGKFAGVFKGESNPFLLQWKQNEKDISVGALGAAPSSSDWKVLPKDVTKESFTMKTQSTSYDYPNMTTIALTFKAVQ